MNLSNICVPTGRILSLIDWEEVGLIVFHGLITFAVGIYVAGETLGNWVHRTNDQLAANWVRMLALTPVMEEEENEEDEVPLPTVSSPPTEVGQAPLPVITEEVSVPTPPTVVEVEPLLPQVAEVVEISTLQEQPPPVRRRRRSSAPRSLEETVNEEVEPPTTRRPRGPKAHRRRVRRTLAA
ncbi:MAG: hypothetical protein RJB24_320 [Candidatus Parcubacteria bacterium]